MQRQILCWSLNRTLGSDVALSRAAVRNKLGILIIRTLELRATGAGRVTTNVGALSILALGGEVLSGSEAGSLLHIGADNIVVVVTTTLVVGPGELV
ncbi:hypothetical protein HG530_007657 [Fusarium avenaceum]|nr:hypothetical protein HG530_007657 [Fusarium avenaceum]